jgi:hypothetical protein
VKDSDENKLESTTNSTEIEIDGSQVDNGAIGKRMAKSVSKRTRKAWGWAPKRDDGSTYKPTKPYRRGE